MTVSSFDRLSSRVSRRAVVTSALAAPLAAALIRAPRVGAQDAITVTMVTDTAGLGDRNFNDSAKAGLDLAVTDFGITGEVIESTETSQYVQNLINAAEQSELTVGVGFLLTDAITEVAGQYPDDFFLLIDAVSEAPNVAGVTFREHEAAFLAGVISGLTTSTNLLGIVGGQRIPPVIRYEVGFIAGVKSVNAAAGDTVIVAYTDSFGDPALGKEFALAQYNEGADIVLPIAGRTGIGCYEAAVEKGPEFYVVGADVDQDYLAPGQQVCTAFKGVGDALYLATQQVIEGSFVGGPQDLGLVEGGVDLTVPGAMVTPDTLAIMERYKAAIIAGTLTVPATDEELAAYTPTAPDALSAASPVATPEASPAA